MRQLNLCEQSRSLGAITKTFKKHFPTDIGLRGLVGNINCLAVSGYAPLVAGLLCPVASRSTVTAIVPSLRSQVLVIWIIIWPQFVSRYFVPCNLAFLQAFFSEGHTYRGVFPHSFDIFSRNFFIFHIFLIFFSKYVKFNELDVFASGEFHE